MTKISRNCEVVISGGGPVGLILAIGLARQGRSVLLAEPVAPQSNQPNSFDGRVLALTYGSQQVLQALGIWNALVDYCTPILHVHVSQKGYMGLTTLHAEETGVPALGYSVQASDLGNVLWRQAQQEPLIEILSPAKVIDFTDAQDGVQVIIEDLSVSDDSVEASLIKCTAQLLIGADGTHSKVRQLMGLPLHEKSYHAYGILAKIETEAHPEGWSFERFTEEGPVALLPMDGHFHKAVLVCPEEKKDAIMALNDEAYMALFADKMGERLGGFTSISERVAYPLKETYVDTMTQGRELLMGNASHTQHPVAAQGLNLGIRDIEDFLRLAEQQNDLGNTEFLQGYAGKREPDHRKVMGMTDGLIQIFQHSSPLVGHLRGIGLMALQRMPKLKQRFSRFAMGNQRHG
ncbi:FAD-dependent monooxygenase [Thiomicrorhabdus sp.]|uniref:FAD-dependent monooxygenase n=1 Tax=Thiomicrorhabdus sp. TaxID=2039724 RepID=UPI0029C928B4|nr:FAD-dependent monooxygenase [Thiomicrorhabdus sp.]